MADVGTKADQVLDLLSPRYTDVFPHPPKFVRFETMTYNYGPYFSPLSPWWSRKMAAEGDPAWPEGSTDTSLVNKPLDEQQVYIMLPEATDGSWEHPSPLRVLADGQGAHFLFGMAVHRRDLLQQTDFRFFRRPAVSIPIEAIEAAFSRARRDLQTYTARFDAK